MSNCNKSNGVKLTKCDSQQWKTASLLDSTVVGSVKLAGEEAKDRLYEPKHKKKLFRVLTVVAYVFFVSLAAIMLSLYYIFIWNGQQSVVAKQQGQLVSDNKCENIVAEIQRQIKTMDGQHPWALPKQMTFSTAAPEPKWNDKYDEIDYGNNNFAKKLFQLYPSD